MNIMAELNVGKVYIIHYKKAVNRKEHMLNFLNSNNIKNYEFRDFYQREDLSQELFDKYTNFNSSNGWKTGHDRVYACTAIEHIETYRDILNNGLDNKWYLILEDDSFPVDNFVEELNNYLANVPEDAEYLDINCFWKMESPNMWERKNGTRLTMSYLVNKECCRKILSTIIPVETSIDCELNKHFKIHDLKVYWSNKPLVYFNDAVIPSTY